MSVPVTGKRCPRCGHINPPDALYCERCGARLEGGPGETQVLAPTFATAQPRPVIVSTGGQQPQQGGASGETMVAPLQPQQPVQPAQPAGGYAPLAPALPIPYRLVFPDGRYIEVYEQLRIFGREDFEGLIPEPYIQYITRREKGGQFRIWCEVKSVNEVVCYIRDDYSTNPTYVNNQPIRGMGWVKLNDGDIISPARVVNIVFKFAVPMGTQQAA